MLRACCVIFVAPASRLLFFLKLEKNRAHQIAGMGRRLATIPFGGVFIRVLDGGLCVATED